jgi:benzylsuccinate CoA-transferase BbsF subunit
MGALSGVKVLEFGGMLAGAVTTKHLALMGAEVIKVESSKRMDITRVQHPGAHVALIDAAPTDTFMTNETNLNKLDVTLNLSHPEGVLLARRLVAISDVLVENFRPGVMDRIGLGYQALKEMKSDLVMLSVSMAGGNGPEAHYTGYAPIFSALGGVGHLTGYPDGPATEIRFPVDVMVGTTAAFAILAALIHRQQTGEGQHIDLSAREAASCLISDSIMDYTMNGRNQSREGNRDEVMAPHNCYACMGEDKWISIAVKTEDEWSALCQTMGNPPWARDKRFADGASRWSNQEILDTYISEWAAQYTHYELMGILQKARIAAVPSFNAEELCSDPHLNERGLLVVVDHSTLGAQTVFSPPAKLSLTPAEVLSPGPALGQHNHYVFKELLNLSEQEITDLMESEVIC